MQFATTGLTIFLISITVGYLVSRTFLKPVGELADGITAIQKRNFRHKVMVIDEDELGVLSSAFNEMLEGLSDLEIAKTIQETLFPQEPLEAGHWEVYGSCVPASQVGGDYFDYFRAGENRIVIVIGDVAGHGVSAALIMAMAKAVIAHPGNELSPVRLLENLHAVLLPVMKRRKVMTCFVGILDTESNRFSGTNAGHSFPLLARGKKAEFLELRGKPLGTKLFCPSAQTSIEIEKDDCLILYTDGLVEAKNSSGEMIGYENFRAALPELIENCAVETEARIRRWHADFSPLKVPEDDISLVVVQSSITRIQSKC